MEQAGWASETSLPGFEELLARLAEAHQREILELRAENKALRTAVRQQRASAESAEWPLPGPPDPSASPGPLWASGPRNRSSDGSGVSAKAARSRGQQPEQSPGDVSTATPPPVRQQGPHVTPSVQPEAPEGEEEAAQAAPPVQLVALEAHEPRRDSHPESPAAKHAIRRSMSATSMSSAAAVRVVSSAYVRVKKMKILREPVPKGISFDILCMERFPGRQWADLTLKEQVHVLRMALKSHSYLISPYCRFMKWWDMVISIGLLFVGIVTPYEVVFINEILWGLFYVNRALDVVFLTDIFIQFFLQVEVKRPHRGGTILLRHPYVIRKRYLSSWFVIDMLSIFPVDILSVVLMSSQDVLKRAKLVRCLKLLKIAKLLRILRSSRILQRWKNLLAIPFATQKLISFLLALVTVSHWMACLWGLTGLTLGAELCDDNDELITEGVDAHEVSWVTALYIDGKTSPDHPCNHFEVYLASLHWAVMTLTSIGYGDIVPVRLEEYIVCIVCMLIGGVLWAYVIGSLCNIMSTTRRHESKFEMATDLLNSAMEEAGVPLKERPIFREYLREAKAYDRRVSFGEVADSLSPMLRQKLLYHVTKDALQSVYYFKHKDAPESFLMDIASCLVPRFFSRGEPLDCLRYHLCLVDRGTVAHGGKILSPPSVFHEDFIITLRRYQKSTRTVSLTYTQLLVLSRKSMDGILEKYPEFERTIRRYALKAAFCRAVRITVSAFHRTVARRPDGLTLHFADAFDQACVYGAPAFQISTRHGRSESTLALGEPAAVSGRARAAGH